MGFIRKNSLLFLASGILLLYIITRFSNILGLPVFTDEAIYIRWSQYFLSDLKFWDYSMTDGKQPMFIWIAMFFMKFIQDPLLAGRMVSVLAGFGSTVGMFFLATETFKNKKIGFLASLIYVLYPFSLVYDRMALYDSLVAMFIIWSLYLEILLVRRIRLQYALLLGLVIGGGMLTKTNADFALILLPFSLLLFNFKGVKNPSTLLRTKKFWLWIIYAAIAAIIANAIYLLLRFSPFFHIIADKNLVFIYSFSEWRQHPLTYLWNNLRAMLDWFITYATIPFIILIISSFVAGKKFFQEKVLLVLWFVIPFIALALFGRTLYPRFILFMTMPLLVLGAYTFYSLQAFSKKIWPKIFIFLVFFSLFFAKDFFIISNFSKAPIPLPDHDQFYAGWPSGVGIPETIAILKEKAKKEKIYVGTEGTFGLLPYAIEMYLKDNPNIIIKGFWPIDETPPKELIEASKKMPTFVIFYQYCPSCKPHVGDAPLSWPLTPVYRVEKQEGGRFYTLYQVKTP